MLGRCGAASERPLEGVMEDDLDADENGDAGTESGMTACEVVRTKWLQSGGAFPPLLSKFSYLKGP